MDETNELPTDWAKRIWPTIPYEHRLAAAVHIFSEICEHARHTGSFRYLIYDRLGFDNNAYTDLYLAGGMDISNGFNLPNSDDLVRFNSIDELIADLEGETE